MKIPPEITLWIQKTLLGIDGEEWGIAYVASRMSSIPEEPLNHWQLVVDLLYRLLECNLVEVYIFIGCGDKESLLQQIRTVSPFDRLGGLLWNGTQMRGTKSLSVLIESYFPPLDRRDSNLNAAFIEALEKIFAENGVPWSDKPLLPIAPASAKAPASR